MTYGVLFAGDKILSPYGSIEDILNLPCFTNPTNTTDPTQWEILVPPERYRVTKTICLHTPAQQITGQIVRFKGE